MNFLMVFDFTQFWLDGRPGNEYFWISHKISGHLTPMTPLGVHPQWFETTWNRYKRFLLLWQMFWKWYFLNYIQQTTIKSPLRGSFTLLVWLKYVVPDTFGATFPFFVRPCCTVTEVRCDNRELKWSCR